MNETDDPTRQRRADWEQRYADGRTGWDRGEPSPALQRWLDAGVVPRGPLLVPGCGNGHEVLELARRGFSVTAVDIAEPPLSSLRERLRREHLSAELVHADLLQWQPAAPFAAIYEQTCLCALDPAHRADYEHRLFGWLAPGGRLLAVFLQTDKPGGPPFDCPASAMRELFAPSRWRWPVSPAFELPHPNGPHETAFVLERS